MTAGRPPKHRQFRLAQTGDCFFLPVVPDKIKSLVKYYNHVAKYDGPAWRFTYEGGTKFVNGQKIQGTYIRRVK